MQTNMKLNASKFKKDNKLYDTNGYYKNNNKLYYLSIEIFRAILIILSIFYDRLYKEPLQWKWRNYTLHVQLYYYILPLTIHILIQLTYCCKDHGRPQYKQEIDRAFLITLWIVKTLGLIVRSPLQDQLCLPPENSQSCCNKALSSTYLKRANY